MDPWFADDGEYIRLWAWLARAPAKVEDARCRGTNRDPQAGAFNSPGVYEGSSGISTPILLRLTAGLRAADYRLIP